MAKEEEGQSIINLEPTDHAEAIQRDLEPIAQRARKQTRLRRDLTFFVFFPFFLIPQNFINQQNDD